MYEISYRANGDKRDRKISVIDKDYAIFIVSHIVKCWDLNTITVIDGLTGEVLYAYSDNAITFCSGDFV